MIPTENSRNTDGSGIGLAPTIIGDPELSYVKELRDTESVSES